MTHAPDAAGIPRRLFLRLALAVLSDRADRLEQKANRTRDARRNVPIPPGKRIGRATAAESLRDHARRIDRMIASVTECAGEPLDAALCGYLIAWCGGDGLARSRLELRDLDASPVLDGIAESDYHGGIVAVLREMR